MNAFVTSPDTVSTTASPGPSCRLHQHGAARPGGEPVRVALDVDPVGDGERLRVQADHPVVGHARGPDRAVQHEQVLDPGAHRLAPQHLLLRAWLHPHHPAAGEVADVQRTVARPQPSAARRRRRSAAAGRRRPGPPRRGRRPPGGRRTGARPSRVRPSGCSPRVTVRTTVRDAVSTSVRPPSRIVVTHSEPSSSCRRKGVRPTAIASPAVPSSCTGAMASLCDHAVHTVPSAAWAKPDRAEPPTRRRSRSALPEPPPPRDTAAWRQP